MIINSDYVFWLAIYRAVMAIAAAIKRYKLDQNKNDEIVERNLEDG
jgi:hypothetical protein